MCVIMYNDFIKTDVTQQYKYYAYAFKYVYNNSLIFS
jgi:hypothetical protein